jgi:lipid A 3-O-deacylase PagL
MVPVPSLGLGISTRSLATGGALQGAGETNFVGTAVPTVAFGRKDERISIHMEGGGALLSDHKFGAQNFGGSFQFVWSFGLNVGLLGPLGAGYHVQHYFDATLYGHDSRGVDLHLFEVAYRH